MKPRVNVFALVGVLIVVGILADLADFIAYQMYLSTCSIGLFEAVPWSMTWTYLTSPLGVVLTILGLAPWIILLGFLYLRKT